MLLKKEEIEMDFAKKQEKAVQDALKIRLHKTTCDCCKKTVDNSKDKKGYNTYYFMWGNRFLCEKCMTFQMFKSYPGLILQFLGEMLAVIIRLPFKPFRRALCVLNTVHSKIYLLLSKICSFFWTYFNKLGNKNYDKWEELIHTDFEAANSCYEKISKYYNYSHAFFQYYMHWDDMWKLVIATKFEDYRFKEWKRDINGWTPGLKWLL